MNKARTETVLNDKATHGLRAQFSLERVQAILTQAHSMFQEPQRRSGTSVETTAEKLRSDPESQRRYLGVEPVAET